MKKSSKAENSYLICKNYEELCEEAVQKILALSKEAIEARNQFNLVLSGGSTPKDVYRKMASPSYRNAFDWHKINLFWGDERWVPPSESRSNYGMVAEALLTRVDIPYQNIHPIKTSEANPQITAAAYEKELQAHFGLGKGEIPTFDLILLGVGQDGHVASLFPDDVEALNEKNRLIIPTHIRETEQFRISLTFPVINHARHILFLVSGGEKSKILQSIFEGPSPEKILPVQNVHPAHGTVHWLMDKSAASLLKHVDS